MIGFAILAVYLLGWIVAATIAARASRYSKRDDVEFLDAVIGAMAGLLWPLMVFPALVLGLANRETPTERRDRIAVERDDRVREQSRTIARLEREAGIR